jgi:hypothetical protein
MKNKMDNDNFVNDGSIVRKIWGNSDTILFIFAGASAEFALNKAVDWLYFTGKLPADPLGRLFSTVAYARKIVFAPRVEAYRAIDSMAAIHSTVEANRGAKIPDWAYRDVLFMLIDYSIRSFEVLERKLDETEKQEVFDVFNRVGTRMGLKGLPEDYPAWEKMRAEHLAQNLEYSIYTEDLFRQYRKHLGFIRYKILREVQILIAPPEVKHGLTHKKTSFVKQLIALYKSSRIVHADGILKDMILPSKYKKEIKGLNIAGR